MIDISLSLESLNKSSYGNLGQTLGIEFIEINPGYLKARMAVLPSLTQPLGLLSGGASAALAETTGSMAAYLSLDRKNFYCLGLELKINHIKSASAGYVYATATPLHTGITTHVWQIQNRDESGDLISHAVLTMAIVPLDDFTRKAFGKKLAGMF